jgi:hypothetical protein
MAASSSSAASRADRSGSAWSDTAAFITCCTVETILPRLGRVRPTAEILAALA